MFRKIVFLALPVAAAMGPVAYYSGPDWYSQARESLLPATKNEASSGYKRYADLYPDSDQSAFRVQRRDRSYWVE